MDGQTLSFAVQIMTQTAMLRLRATLGLVLAIAPAFPIFQIGRFSTLRGALVTIGATVVAVLMAWWTRPDPELPQRWTRMMVIGIVGGMLMSWVVAYGMGANLATIARFSWIPFLRAVVVSTGMCMMLSTVGGPIPAFPSEEEAGANSQPQPRSS
jgi:hypothetical protein